MLEFTTPLDETPGVIASLLKKSYADLVANEPSLWKAEETRDIPGLWIDAENFFGQSTEVALNRVPLEGGLTVCKFNLFLCHIRLTSVQMK